MWYFYTSLLKILDAPNFWPNLCRHGRERYGMLQLCLLSYKAISVLCTRKYIATVDVLLSLSSCITMFFTLSNTIGIGNKSGESAIATATAGKTLPKKHFTWKKEKICCGKIKMGYQRYGSATESSLPAKSPVTLFSPNVM